MTLAPITHGPTWMKNEDGSWFLPRHTLGWSVIEWASGVLLQPDGPDAGQPWRWTNEQARFILWWYAVDETGHFVYRRGVLRRLKGHGKDPLAAALALVEFIGPCRFGGWDADGDPIAIPHPAPWIQIAATNVTQTKNTFNLFPGFLGSKQRAIELGVDLGIEIIHGPGSARIEAVTSSPRALEGARPSMVLLGEALALDTPIPIPDGWSTVGDLKVGDDVYGSDGSPVEVIYTTPVIEGRPCFKITFADNTSIVADEGHLWELVVDKEVVSTRFLFEHHQQSMLIMRRMRPDTPGLNLVSVIKVEPVTSVPVKCIEVRSADHLFVAGDGWTVTHNTQHWLPTNQGRNMAQAIARNLAKSRDGSARSLALTNAHEPGEDSVGEADWDAYQLMESGKSRATGLLYDSIEAPDETTLRDIDSLRAGLIAARGDSTWLDVERLIEEIMDPVTPASMSARFYLNKLVAADDAYLSPSEWGKCKSDLTLQPGDTISLFFDGSESSDHSGLVACRIDDGLLSVLGHWDPALELDGHIDRAKVMKLVDDVFEVYDVVAFYADVRYWESEVDRWRDLYQDQLLVTASAMSAGKKAHAVNWDMRPPARQREFTETVDKFLALTLSGDTRHDGNKALTQHMTNAKRQPNKYGFSIRKDVRDSPRKIDLAVCAIGASKARWDVIATKALDKRLGPVGGEVYAF